MNEPEAPAPLSIEESEAKVVAAWKGRDTARRMAALKTLQPGDVLVEDYGTESVGRIIRVVSSVGTQAVYCSATLHVGCSGNFYAATGDGGCTFDYLAGLNLRLLRATEGAI